MTDYFTCQLSPIRLQYPYDTMYIVKARSKNYDTIPVDIGIVDIAKISIYQHISSCNT